MGTTVCRWCDGPIPAEARSDSEFCGKRCRQTAFRLRQRQQIEARDAQPMLMAYADPPYPKNAWRYKSEPSYGGEVDHEALIASLRDSYDGWALSTSEDALPKLLPLCGDGIKICPWIKPIGAAPATYGPHNCWEPLIVKPGRLLRPGFRDWLNAQPARGHGSLTGRKPLAFCAWLFQCLGLLPGDRLADLYPGTGIVGRAWREVSRQGQQLSLPAAGDVVESVDTAPQLDTES